MLEVTVIFSGPQKRQQPGNGKNYFPLADPHHSKRNLSEVLVEGN